MTDLPYDFIDTEQPERKPAVQRRVEMRGEAPEGNLRCVALPEMKKRDDVFTPHHNVKSDTDKVGESDNSSFFGKVMQMIRGAF